MNPAVFFDIIICHIVAKIWTYKKTSMAVAGILGLAMFQPSTPVAVPYWLTNNSDQHSVIRYGASGDYRQARVSGAHSASDSTIDLETGQGAYFRAGQNVAIPFAGPAHVLAAVTPAAPKVMMGGSGQEYSSSHSNRIIFRRVSGNIVEQLTSEREMDFLGYGTNFTFTADAGTNLITTQVPIGIDDGHTLHFETTGALPGGMTTGPWYARRVTDYTYSLHSSQANAISNTSPLDITSTGSGTHTYHVEILVNVFTSTTLPSPLAIATNYWLRRDTGSLRYWTFHTSAAGAAANTGVVTLSDNGTGKHYMQVLGTTTINYRIVAHSAGSGYTVRSASASTTIAPATLKQSAGVSITWDYVTDGGSNYAAYYTLYSDRNGGDHVIKRVSGTPTAMKIVMQAGGYVNCVPTDIGSPVSYSGDVRAYLAWYDNPTRTWIVKRDGTNDTFPNGSVCTLADGSGTATGTGAGTTTGAPTYCFAEFDGGDKDVNYDNRTLALRTGVEVQLVQISGTPTGGTNSWTWGGNQVVLAYNASAATVLDALNNFPGLSGINVTTIGSSPNFTYIITFQNAEERGLGNIPQLMMFSSMTGGSPVVSFGTVREGASYIPGDIILHPPTSAGNWFECRSATGDRAGRLAEVALSTTLNATTADAHDLLWTRRDAMYPITSPTAATADIQLARVVGVSGDTLTIDTDSGTGGNQGITSGVPDDTPFFHNDWPGIKAAITAAASGDTIVFPQGDYDCFTRGFTSSDWTTSEGGSVDKTMYRFSSPQANYVFDGHNSVVRWRPTDMVVETGDQGAPTDNIVDSCSHFDFWKCQDVTFRDLTYVCAPVGEPRSEINSAQAQNSWGRVGLGGGEDETAGRRSFHNVKWLGYKNIGALAQTDGDGLTPQFWGCEVLYGGNGHDACLSDGEYYNCRIEGVGRWRSQGYYGSETKRVSKLINCDFWHIGSDGLRIRSPNFEVQGGSITNYWGHETTNPLLIESLAVGCRVTGMRINMVGEFVDIGADGTVFTNNSLQGCQVQGAASNVTCSSNRIGHNDWVRNLSLNAFQPTGANWIINNNIVDSQATFSNGSATRNEGHCTMGGIYLSGSGCTGIVANGNQVKATANALQSVSSFVGTANITGGRYYSTDLVHNSNNESCRFASGNGASMTFTGVEFDALSKDDEVWVGGTSSCKYVFKTCKFLCEFELDPALTNTGNTIESNDFADATQAVDFADAGTLIVGNDFATAPSLTGATLFTRGNRVAGSATTAVTLSASQNDYAWPVTDTVLFDTTGTNNYSITGVAIRAKGSIINVVNVDATDNITIEQIDAASAAANRFNNNSGADAVVGPLDSWSWISSQNATAGWSQN